MVGVDLLKADLDNLFQDVGHLLTRHLICRRHMHKQHLAPIATETAVVDILAQIPETITNSFSDPPSTNRGRKFQSRLNSKALISLYSIAKYINIRQLSEKSSCPQLTSI